ncbi:MAG: DUF72 domain-containing protein [Candidatus Thermoplasmatota archaeon]|nr:DUF72 domain-containing protein [Candidatus Thermoplasmatota archaeon]
MSGKSIKIGTCGYGYYEPNEGWKERYESKLQAYADEFETGEINKTFYKLPMVKTAERWRENARDDFEFTLKTWQALTHPTTSPTWRNKKDKLSGSQKENFGYLRPNDDVVEAWERTKEIAEALEAEVCLIQTPGSFEPRDENEKNMRQFFERIDREGLTIAWEPRGEWKEDPGKVKEVCDDLDLIHVVDIMRREPVSDHSIAYTRLHGLNPDEYDYAYDYSEEELQELAEKLEELSEEHGKVYCMFNNYEMFENAKKLRKMV